MLEISGRNDSNDGRISRRAALKVGTLAIGGFTLPEYLRLKAATNPKPQRGSTSRDAGAQTSRPKAAGCAADTAVIQIWIGGGPSHIDTYDMKPLAPAEIRGEFQEIETNVAGVRVCEHLPLQARVMDKLAVVRSVSHSNAGHLPASQWMLTGYHVPNFTPDNVHPSSGSVAARLRGPSAPGIPAYVAIPRKTSYGNAAYLGPAYKPFTTDSDPYYDDFAVSNLKLPPQVSTDRLGDRRALLSGLDTIRRDLDAKGEIAGIDRFYQEAIDMITSDRAVRAFDIQREDPQVRARYGRTSVGQGCLLARRLVEAGATFVTVQSGGIWDTHEKNFFSLRTNSLPKIDRAVAALVADLHERGLDKRVLVMAMGEFGRTPHINPKAGRDHWPGAMSILFGGGGLKMGQTIGTTDRHGAYPATRPLGPGDVLATLYHVLGIDCRHEFHDQTGRIFPVLRDGRRIAELV